MLIIWKIIKWSFFGKKMNFFQMKDYFPNEPCMYGTV